MNAIDATNIIEAVMANAAELGCPRDADVDMWFRNMSKDEQVDVIKHVDRIYDGVFPHENC